MAGSIEVGRVVDFDDDRGWGTLEILRGGAAHGQIDFHCTAVADGSRALPIGAAAAFRIMPGHRGRWEAACVTRLGVPTRTEPDQTGGESGPGGAD